MQKALVSHGGITIEDNRRPHNAGGALPRNSAKLCGINFFAGSLLVLISTGGIPPVTASNNHSHRIRFVYDGDE